MPTPLEQLQYGFDRDSRRTWRQRATTQGWDNTYAYDSLSQVTGDNRGDLNLGQNAIAGVPASGAHWDYDETGNWHVYQTLQNGAVSLSQSRTHDKGNRLMEVEGAAAMRTDRAGRMIQAVPGPQQDWSQSWQITWDAWSRITQVSHTEGNEIHRYGYDGITRRTSRYNNQTGVTLRSYYNDQWRPVEERKNSETTASASFLWGARYRDDLVRRDRAVGGTSLNETRYILMDYFSPAAITDGGGAVKERYQFSAFGLRTILNPDFTPRTSSECGMEFSFHGQFSDPETGWMNYGHRYYLPDLGRWACKDPIEENGGTNMYVYSINNPVLAVDHLGLLCGPCKDGGFIGPDSLGATCCPEEMQWWKGSLYCHLPEDEEPDPERKGGGGGFALLNYGGGHSHGNREGGDGWDCRDKDGFARCLADVALNFGVGQIWVIGNALGAAGIEFNPFQNWGRADGPPGVNWGLFGSDSDPGVGNASGAAGSAGQFINHEYRSQGGDQEYRRLENLVDANRAGQGVREGFSALRSLRRLGKAIPGISNVLGLVDAGQKAIGCHSKYCSF